MQSTLGEPVIENMYLVVAVRNPFLVTVIDFRTIKRQLSEGAAMGDSPSLEDIAMHIVNLPKTHSHCASEDFNQTDLEDRNNCAIFAMQQRWRRENGEWRLESWRMERGCCMIT